MFYLNVWCLKLKYHLRSVFYFSEGHQDLLQVKLQIFLISLMFLTLENFQNNKMKFAKGEKCFPLTFLF